MSLLLYASFDFARLSLLTVWICMSFSRPKAKLCHPYSVVYNFNFRWYHQTHDYYYNQELRQTLQTCETGSGSPSCHAQTAFIFGYVLRQLFHQKISKNYKCVSWMMFWIFQILVTLSRSFVGAHFPHQCALGSFLGDIILLALSVSVNR